MMELYRVKVFRSIPARDVEEATEKLNNGEPYGNTPNYPINAKSMELIIPHEDFVKIFRLARTLTNDEAYDCDTVMCLTKTYAQILGYEITEQETWDGFVTYAEKFSEDDDDEIEDWLN